MAIVRAALAGNDLFTGANGNDFVFAAGGGDTLYGKGGADTLLGEIGNDLLVGGADNDILVGGPGNDRIYGGASVDILVGSPGNDIFVFHALVLVANRDTITDFGQVLGNNDSIYLENAVMPALGPAGPLDPTAFFAGTAAHDASDRIVYNKPTGALFYDADGNLAGTAVLLAIISNKPTLTAADFVVI